MRPRGDVNAEGGLEPPRVSSHNENYFGGDGETRTLTGYPIRPSNVRVYQFRHIPIIMISAASQHFFFNAPATSSVRARLEPAGSRLVPAACRSCWPAHYCFPARPV